MEAVLSKERVLPLTSSHRVTLLNLIKEKPVLQNRSTAPGVAEKKSKAWQEIAATFNSMNPDQHPRTAHQLKRSYDHVKRKYV